MTYDRPGRHIIDAVGLVLIPEKCPKSVSFAHERITESDPGPDLQALNTASRYMDGASTALTGIVPQDWQGANQLNRTPSKRSEMIQQAATPEVNAQPTSPGVSHADSLDADADRPGSQPPSDRPAGK